CIIEEPYKHYFTEKVSYSLRYCHFIDAQASLRNSNAAIQENINILKGLGNKLYSFDHRKSVIIH
ncbi:hypothetical protein, partial [Blautia wexlerae]|uniref:hypothetical protein n=1 Tax=Blautia wexlerae TaxID=418240 RepID=UPI001A9C1667